MGRFYLTHEKNLLTIYYFSNNRLVLGDDRKPTFYVDISQKQIDPKGYEASEELRDKKIPDNLEPGNLFNYELDWSALIGQK